MIRRRLLTGTLSNCVGKVTAIGAWFLLTPLILTRLGTEAYALWVLVCAMATYGLLLELGIGGAVVKYVAQYAASGERDAARAVVASAVWLYAGLALGAVAISAAAAPLVVGLLGLDPSEHRAAAWLVVLTGVNVALAIAFMPASAVLRGLQRYDLYNAVSAVNSLVEAASVAVVLLLGGGLAAMMMALIVIHILTGIASFTLVARIAPDLRIGLRGANAASMRRIASFSASLFAIDVGTRLQSRTDEMVIAAFQALSGVTPYALARKLGELSELAAIQFVKVVMPLASELDAADRPQKLRTLYIVSSRVALAISTPVAVVLMVAGGSVLSVWVGPQYAAHASLVTVLAASTLVGSSQWPAVEILQGMARHRLVAVTWLAAGGANILLSILLLPAFGLLGVALGTLIPTVVASLGVVMPLALRTLRVPVGTALREIWLPALVPGLVTGALFWTVHRQFPSPGVPALLASMAAAGLMYAALYLLMPASAAERRLVADLARAPWRRPREPQLDAATP